MPKELMLLLKGARAENFQIVSGGASPLLEFLRAREMQSVL